LCVHSALHSSFIDNLSFDFEPKHVPPCKGNRCDSTLKAAIMSKWAVKIWCLSVSVSREVVTVAVTKQNSAVSKLKLTACITSFKQR
jgi:hypothetical protein